MKDSLDWQGIYDEKGLFIHVEVRGPRSVHDTRIYANCIIKKKIISRKFHQFMRNLFLDLP